MEEPRQPDTPQARRLITIQLNGEAHTVPVGSSVADLLTALSVDLRQVAVERNEQIVRKPDYEGTGLLEGDRLEVVTFVGGG